MVSIILNSYAPTKNLRHMDMACVAAFYQKIDKAGLTWTSSTNAL